MLQAAITGGSATNDKQATGQANAPDREQAKCFQLIVKGDTSLSRSPSLLL